MHHLLCQFLTSPLAQFRTKLKIWDMIGNAGIGIKEITNICLDIFTVFLSLFLVSPLFLRLPLTGWCAQCTLTLSDIGNALLSYSTRFPSNALFHLSFWNAKQISLLPFFWFLSYGHIIWCITFYLLPLFAEQALRSIFNISHSDSVTWKHQYIKANIISV